MLETADSILVIIEERQVFLKSIAVFIGFRPSIPENLCTVQSKAVLDTAYGFGSADTAGVVGVKELVLTVLDTLELSALFPDHSVSVVMDGVALLFFSIPPFPANVNLLAQNSRTPKEVRLCAKGQKNNSTTICYVYYVLQISNSCVISRT